MIISESSVFDIATFSIFSRAVDDLWTSYLWLDADGGNHGQPYGLFFQPPAITLLRTAYSDDSVRRQLTTTS